MKNKEVNDSGSIMDILSKNITKDNLEISVSGYKSIRNKKSIEIKPLTILAGENSSGKSSIMQPLLMLKQTVESPYEPPGALLIDGNLVSFSLQDQIFSKLSSNNNVEKFVLRITKPNYWINLEYKQGNDGIEITEMTTWRCGAKTSFSLSPVLSLNEVDNLIFDIYNKNVNNFEIDLRSGFLELRVKFLEENNPKKTYTPLLPLYYPILNDSVLDLKSDLKSLIYLKGLRGNPQRTYTKTAAEMFSYKGNFESYVATIIYEWQRTSSEKFDELILSLSELGLTNDIVVSPADETSFEIKVARIKKTGKNKTKKDLVNIVDVGIGVSQVLPVVVALLSAKNGQLVYIEQPEIHLHPKAQVKLAELIAKAAKNGALVVIETHSPLLLLGIQTLIAEGTLPNDLVKLHWFSRDENGFTKIDSVDPDKNGAYGKWPVDFCDVEMNLQTRYLNAT